MRVRLGNQKKQKLNRAPLRAVMNIRARVKVYGIPGSGGGDVNFRILEDNDFRITEDGDFRILE